MAHEFRYSETSAPEDWQEWPVRGTTPTADRRTRTDAKPWPAKPCNANCPQLISFTTLANQFNNSYKPSPR